MFSTSRRLTDLTSEQVEILPAVRDEWIRVGLSTEPADRARAEAAVCGILWDLKLPLPRKIIWYASPYAGFCDRSGRYVGEHLGRPLMFSSQDRRADHRVVQQVQTEVGEPVRTQVWTGVGDRIFEAARDQSDLRSVATVNFGQHMVSDLAVHDFMGRVGLPGPKSLDHYFELAKLAGWWWTKGDDVVMTERPSAIQVDERGRLHSATQKSVEYPDGWGFYSWHGIRVPEDLILRPNALKPNEILAEPNVEVRRCMIERFGADRLMWETDAKVIQQDDFGKLWRLQVPGDEDLLMVEVTNSTPEPDGSFRTYMLRVPPTMHTAHQAVAWTFGRTPLTYGPEIQT